MRQPQFTTKSELAPHTLNMSVAAREPISRPVAVEAGTNEQKKPRRCLGAYSAIKVEAPAYSPDAEKLCTMRKSSSKMGALPLGYITHYIRVHLEDSPIYAQMQDAIDQKSAEAEDHPIRALFTKHGRKTIISFGACVLNAVGFYAVLTYLPNYLEVTLNYDSAAASTITTIVLVLYIAFIFTAGRISDKVGRKRMLITACIGFIIFTIPAFHLLASQDFIVILLVELFMCMLLTINDGSLASYLTETFPTEVRYSGFAFSFNLANAIFGGSASYIGFALTNATGDPVAPAYYLVAIAAIALVAMLLSHEHAGKDLSHVK